MTEHTNVSGEATAKQNRSRGRRPGKDGVRRGFAAGGKGKKGKGRGQRKAPPPALVKKAAEISERTGLDRREALRVASGKATVQQVLKEMLQREKLRKLVTRGELNPMYGPAILAGHMTLERAKFLSNLLKDEAWRSTWSILEDLVDSGEKRVFFLFGREPLTAKVPKVSKYDVWFARDSMEDAEQTEKHNIILTCRPEEKDELLAAKKMDEAVAAKHLGASVSYKDRFRSDKVVFYEHHLSGTPIRVTFRDGMVLTGQVGWFGRWEFELQLSQTCKPVVFRHAMYALETAD